MKPSAMNRRGSGWLRVRGGQSALFVTAASVAGLIGFGCDNHAPSVEQRTNGLIASVATTARRCCERLFPVDTGPGGLWGKSWQREVRAREHARCLTEAEHGRGRCGTMGRDAGHDARSDAGPAHDAAVDAPAIDAGGPGADAAPPDAAPPFNHCPVILSATATPSVVNFGHTTELSAVVTDPDGDPLTLTWSPFSIILTPNTPQTGASTEFQCVAAGDASVQLFVDDGRGPEAIVRDCPASFPVITFTCGTTTCAGNPCDESTPCCSGTVCSAASCQVCVQVASACDSARPCCPGGECKNGFCLAPSPTCMQDGHVCDATHPCCSGAPCTNSICGNACVGTGAACDNTHPCCDGDACSNGTCQVNGCIPRDESCANGGRCCVGPCEQGLCHQPGCPRTFSRCDSTTGGCCSGDICSAGVCTRVVGCLLAGFTCSRGFDCCSGVCANSGVCL
jgi:hypothetical protein